MVGSINGNKGVAVFHDPKTQKPIVINPYHVQRICISNHEPYDTMVHFVGSGAWTYVSESANDATRIWVNALNGVTDIGGTE